MSAVIEYLGKMDITGLENELAVKGYQVDLYGKELAAISSIVANKSLKPVILQDVMKELKDLRFATARLVYSFPDQAKTELSTFLESPPTTGKKMRGYRVSNI